MNVEIAESELAQLKETGHKRIICVDLDGTLAEHKEWRGYTKIGKPIESVVADIRHEACARGAYVIIHTCRVTSPSGRVIPAAVRALEEWLIANNIPYHEIWLSTGKPYGNEYWDNNAVRKP